MYSLPRLTFAALTLAFLAWPPPLLRGDDRAEDEKILQAAGVGVDGPGLLTFFRKRTLTAADQRRVEKLVAQLGDTHFRTRNRANRELLALGPPAVPALRKALASPDGEVRGRAARCLNAIEKSPGPTLPLAALHLLEERRPEQACAVLLAYLPFADNEEVAEEAVAVLPAVAFKDGKADPALAAALGDPHPLRRAAAALTLGRLGTADQRLAVRLLLRDADARVRLKAAHGLMLGKDKAAIPVLVGLLAEGPLEVARQAEDLLAELVETPVSPVELTADAKVRHQVQRAWSDWWKTQEAKIDLKRLAEDGPLARLNRAKKVTTACLNAMLKLDAKEFKKTLRFPFYMQGSPDGGDQVKDPAKIDAMFQMMGNIKELKEQLKLIRFKVVGTGKVDEYLKIATPAEKTFLSKFRKAELVIVYLQILMNGNGLMKEEGAVFVQISGGKAGVVGIGNGKRNQGK